MNLVVFLDTGVLGSVCHPHGNEENKKCVSWLADLLDSGDVRVCFAEVTDYEVRRKLLHLKATRQLARLDELKGTIEFVPINSPAMVRAARIWADARTAGTPTAPEESLDVDAVLCAQALTHVNASEKLLVATTDVGDLTRLGVDASLWRGIAV